MKSVIKNAVFKCEWTLWELLLIVISNYGNRTSSLHIFLSVVFNL